MQTIFKRAKRENFRSQELSNISKSMKIKSMKIKSKIYLILMTNLKSQERTQLLDIREGTEINLALFSQEREMEVFFLKFILM